MDKIGFVGLGKLGLPVAVTMAQDHKVLGYDINPDLMKKRAYEHQERGPLLEDDFQEYFDKANLSFAPLAEVVKQCSLIFVAVQTPHQAKYEGVTRLTDERADFDYSHLIQVAKDLAPLVTPKHTVVIISTVLPGTMAKHILPLLQCHVVYNPYFVAMGTVMYDFLTPEFILLGNGNDVVERFYQDYGFVLCNMSIESAELTKVLYNTFITMKICYANTIMEICDKVSGCHHDEVVGALGKATTRLLSPKYLQGGMGDGGGCHPRDNIAMSWLASELHLSHNLFDDIMKCREDQAEWLAYEMIKTRLPLVILGTAFKPETNITTGSSAVLVANLLRNSGYVPLVDPETVTEPSCFLIGCKHKRFTEYQFPKGSVVLDPHRYIANQPGVTVVRIGE